MSEHPKNSLASNLIAGGTVGILIIIISVSFASVIFSGELSEVLPEGIGLLLFSSFAVSAIAASLSSYQGIIATPQDTTIPVLALVARHIIEKSPAEISGEQAIYTVFAIITLNSVITGILFYLLGRYRLGGLIRFIPYPVVGGFMAGIGVLLIKSAFKPVSGIDTHHLEVAALFHRDVLLQWLPGLIFAAVLFWVLQRTHHAWTILALLGGTIALFYLGLTISGTTLQQAKEMGLLLGELPAGNLFHFAAIPAIRQANWEMVLNELPYLAALWLIEAIALLFSASGIELAISRDLDLNHELRIGGIASVVSGLGGGVSGFLTMGETNLARHLGGRGRLVGWTISALCLATMLAGSGLVSLLPKMIVVGVPFLLGLDLLHEWLYRAWFKFDRSDFAIIVLIVLVISTVGYIQGVGVGLIAAIVLFVISCSRLGVTKRAVSGAYYHSNVLRTPEEIKLLEQVGDCIYILELQGLIFFGTANSLLNQIRDRLTEPKQMPVEYLLLDFRLVRELDSSAALSFSKLTQIAEQYHLHLLFTHLSPDIKRKLQQGGGLDEHHPQSQVFSDLDHALEWCEGQLLAELISQSQGTVTLQEGLEATFTDPKQVARLITHLEPIELAQGEYLFQQGDPFNGLYFVGWGQVSVVINLGDGKTKRVRTYTTGHSIGEMGLYRKVPRSASVIADMPSRLYFLSTESFERIETEEPLLAANFHRFIVNLLAERLHHREEEMKHLLQ